MNDVATVPLLADLQGPWVSLRLEPLGPGAPDSVLSLPDIYPFMSITELKRRLWLHQGGDPRWDPERVFVGVRSTTDPTRIRPLEFYWPTAAEPTLVDPMVATRAPSPLLVDDAGNRKPLQPTMIGSLLLEVALAPTDTVVAVNLAALIADLTPDQLTPALFAGFYQLYFPWLTAPGQVLDAANTTSTKATQDSYAVSVPYLEDRTGRIGIVQRALARGLGGLSMTMTSMVRLRWLLPVPASRPESLEKTFYGLKATPTIPFLRYFPAEGTGSPLVKLALQDNGSPVLADPKILTSYLNQPAPNQRMGVIVARMPLSSTHAAPGASLLAYMFEDGPTDMVFEVPQRGMTYIAAIAVEAQALLREVMVMMGYPPTEAPTLRDLFATYKWSHPTPQTAAPLTTARLRSRVAALTPFLDPVSLETDETALTAFHWRAVSNYESETAKFAFITQMVLRTEKEGLPAGRTPAAAHSAYLNEIAQRFGLTTEQAGILLDRWMERRGEAVAPGPGMAAGAKAVPAHSTGARIAIAGTHPEYTVEIHGASSPEELQRIVSVVGVLLGASATELSLAPPTTAVSLLTEVVAVKEQAVVAAAAAGAASIPAEEQPELDPAMDDLLADLGFDYGGDGEEAEEEPAAVEPGPEEEEAVAATGGAAAAPNLETGVEEECRANPWTADEPALRPKPDWYMARLKRQDFVMFGFSTPTGRVKSYSKSCQRRDDRQPNIMTLAEYRRIRRCYQDRIRFVDLPPRKPEDLPNDPEYNPDKEYDDEYFLTDPETGNPMWTVYNYENKTTPGQFVYLMCAELWCERDNLPLVRSEFEGTQGRGFSKPANTCPFCGGRPFESLKEPVPGESVIVRSPKDATGKLHAFIGAISRNKHPKGYPLPCCDSTPRRLRDYMDAHANGDIVWGFDMATLDRKAEKEKKEKERKSGMKKGAVALLPLPEEEAEPPPGLMAVEQMGVGTTADEPRIDYGRILSTIRSQYILGADKTLRPGTFGLLSPAMDAFFGQNGSAALESRGIRPTFREGTTVFIRLGVDNRIRAPGLNLFAALAPLLGFESAEETQRAFLKLRAAPAFESANYGTLLHEFAARPSPPSGRFEKSLAEFATEFRYPLDTARAHVLRVYRAWCSYLSYLNNISTPKQIRHIEHLLAQPGVVTPRGLLLVVLEQVGDKIHVACPSFGIPPGSGFGDVPVAFLWHDRRDETWEPLILYNDSRNAGTRNAMYLFGERSSDLEALPTALKAQLAQWIRDWRSSSKGCGRATPPPHVWTPDRDTAGLPRLRQLLVPSADAETGEAAAMNIRALVRDRSNRLVGVLAPLFIPCLDDGTLAADRPRIYEATMIPPAPLADYLKLYSMLAVRFPALKPTHVVATLRDKATIVGFQTAVGTFVPVAPEPVPTGTVAPPLPLQQVDQFPWERDALILREPGAPMIATAALEESMASIDEQLAEAYQHLRLSFSRWLRRDAAGLPLQQEIQKILTAVMPLYERRKRMDLLLEPYVREMVVVEPGERRAMSLLRQDCLSLPQTDCAAAGACRWGGGRCLIHAPTSDATAAATDPIRIFTARLSDELLRYAVRRRELFEETVSEIRTPRGVVRIGNELYMATRPKESASSVLERLGLTGETEMTFPEEMLRFDGLEEAAEEIRAETVAAGGVAQIPDYADDKLPSSWIAKGIQLPQPSPDLPDPRGAAFYAATNKTLADWSSLVQGVSLRGDKTTPFNWSMRDMFIIANRLNMNILYIRDGRIRLWIRPASGSPTHSILFWGPKELILSKGMTWFFKESQLPEDLLKAMDQTPPADSETFTGPVSAAGGAAMAP